MAGRGWRGAVNQVVLVVRRVRRRPSGASRRAQICDEFVVRDTRCQRRPRTPLAGVRRRRYVHRVDHVHDVIDGGLLGSDRALTSPPPPSVRLVAYMSMTAIPSAGTSFTPEGGHKECSLK